MVQGTFAPRAAARRRQAGRMAAETASPTPSARIATPGGHRRATTWWATSAAAAAIAPVASGIGLAAVDGIYGRETAPFIDQAIAQDVVNLTIAAPVSYTHLRAHETDSYL